MQKKVIVVIPTYNSWKTLKSAINSFKDQTLKPQEIIVVNNASTDRTHQLEEKFPNVKWFNLKINYGVSGGRNLGIEKAGKKYDYLLFFDHDMVADKNMIKKLVETAEKKESIGIVTPKIYYWQDKQSLLSKDSRKRIWSAGTGMNLWTGQVLFRGGVDAGQYEEVEEVQVAPATLLVKKDVIDKIAGFDNRYFATYEDTDFCFKAKRHGYKTYYNPQAVAFHKLSTDKNKERERLLGRAYYVGRNRTLFMSKFANNFFVYLLFSPVHTLYFLLISLQSRNLKGFLGYLSGYVAGLKEELLVKRWLIHIPFSRINILRGAIGKTNTVLDVGCGNGALMEILNSDNKWELDGIDIYEPDVIRARTNGVYRRVVVGDVMKLKRFVKKKYDVVFCSQVLEHLKKKESLKLMEEIEGLGRKVVLTTPRHLLEKHDPYPEEGPNPYQAHLSAWTIGDYETKGYKVRGRGTLFLFGEQGLVNKKPFNLKYLRPVSSIIFQLLALMLAPLSYYYPKLSTGLLAIKKIEK